MIEVEDPPLDVEATGGGVSRVSKFKIDEKTEDVDIYVHALCSRARLYDYTITKSKRFMPKCCASVRFYPVQTCLCIHVVQ